ncbi:MAG TPA: hypothetical protein VGR02_22210 [Thermoanaerobaculia bacterium]|jgi:hypothetical protein|nr:hypothetical protein [Thermoanaerobaculia bacterium]
MSRRLQLYERFGEPLLSRSAFLARAAWHFMLATAVILCALAIGIVGYHTFDRLSWTDSLLNASMLLGGMGPVSPIVGTPAKLFASFYALFAGLVFVTASGLILGPWLHRLIHHFHIGEEEPR